MVGLDAQDVMASGQPRPEAPAGESKLLAGETLANTVTLLEEQRQALIEVATRIAIEVRNDEYMKRRRRLWPALQRLGIGGDPFPWRSLWAW